ncbi:MAG: Hpt domain-containing protein, partial [Eubacteriales bacterium]
MGLNLDASPEELKVFLEEADEHFQTLEEDLIRLEKEEEFNEDLMQEIFRASHTLKGSSATIGHNRMAQLTHGMENVLDKLRKKQLTVTSDLVDIMFECLDCLKVLRDEILNDEESDLELGDILGKLGSVHDAAPGSDFPTTTQPAPDKTPGKQTEAKISIDLSWEERDTLANASERGLKPYVIQLLFDVELEMLAVRTFVTLMALNETGEMLKSNPSADEIEREQVTDTLIMLILMKDDEAKIREVISTLPNIAQYEIQPFNDNVTQGEAPSIQRVEKAGEAEA